MGNFPEHDVGENELQRRASELTFGAGVAPWQLPFLERLLRSRKVFLTAQMEREIKNWTQELTKDR